MDLGSTSILQAIYPGWGKISFEQMVGEMRKAVMVDPVETTSSSNARFKDPPKPDRFVLACGT